MTEADTKAFVLWLHTQNVLASVTQCQHCNAWGFWVLGRFKREPLTCGRMSCLKALGDPLGRTSY